MQPLLILQKGNCRIEVTPVRGVWQFATVQGNKILSTEYVTEKDVNSMIGFLARNGYRTIEETVNKAKSDHWHRNNQFNQALEKDK